MLIAVMGTPGYARVHTALCELCKHRLQLAVNFLLLNPSDMNDAGKAHFPGLAGVLRN